MLYLDGGVVLRGTGRATFAGITTFTTNGAPTGPAAQLGRLSLNARCQVEFSGSHVCSEYEWVESTPTSEVPPPAAWLEYSIRDLGVLTNDRSANGGCARWTSAAAGSGLTCATPTGDIGGATGVSCASVLPIACCRAPSAPVFRGITTFVTNGAPTGPGAQRGRLAMNARCHAEFPGAHICSEYEWVLSTPSLPVPAPAAWLEYSITNLGVLTRDRSANGGCASWTSATAGSGGTYAAPTGTIGGATGVSCASALPLACCE